MAEKEDSFNYTYVLIGIGIFLAIIIAAIVLRISFENKSKFGNLSSYYLPIFSFGNTEFPPLEFPP
jgi:hypothetical protein